jgi:hypothetical protein
MIEKEMELEIWVFFQGAFNVLHQLLFFLPRAKVEGGDGEVCMCVGNVFHYGIVEFGGGVEEGEVGRGMEGETGEEGGELGGESV